MVQFQFVDMVLANLDDEQEIEILKVSPSELMDVGLGWLPLCFYLF